MGEFSNIAWTDSTFNPWVGCTKVSAGCTHCYAEDFDKRTNAKTGKALRWGKGAPRTRTKPGVWNGPVKWNEAAAKEGRRQKVFCASLADVFDDEVPRAWLQDLFALIKKTPNLDWLLCTKRPENYDRLDGGSDPETGGVLNVWPKNVWLGVTVENQEAADLRIPLLLKQDAVVRFLSMEPLLGPVDLSAYMGGPYVALPGDEVVANHNEGIDWVIVGGESGDKARPFDLTWARDLKKRTQEAGAAYFLKQLGAKPGVVVDPYPIKHWKGADPAEWPEDLKVRDFPVPRP
jgi:protein gp37